jgi:ribosomal protection tetracycline resistance protein
LKTLNLGIVAHVDAGKTTLTERLLYAAGVIDEIGSVDAGTTQTDSLALERQRGITIKSAVVSFAIDDVTVNLIDTPGHPDFIAEVERVLSVLDGGVLVISAVEGVQPQTRVLMRALQRLRIPTLLFVNKIDRPGAGDERVLRAISERLGLAIVPMGSAGALGTRAADFRLWGADNAAARARLAEVLAERDEVILAAYVENEEGVPYGRLRDALAAQTKRALVHPVFFGSAITGAGVEPLMTGITELLPAAAGDADGPVSGTVFKIERGTGGEKVAFVRMVSGTVKTRDRLSFGRGHEAKVTAIRVFERGSAASERPSVSAGEIGSLWGLHKVQIGDRIGHVGTDGTNHQFAPPTMESVVVASTSDDRARLRIALEQLAEQDPLINVRQDRNEMSMSLYGEVQKEVIQATLANDFGIDVTFRDTTTIYIERPIGNGNAIEFLQQDTNPFSATIGLRVDSAPIGSGVQFELDVDPRSVPTYIYKTAGSFIDSMTQYICRTLQEGLFGWQVTDCTVTMTECGYYIGDGPKKVSGITPRTTAADFRKLTPMVLMLALDRAGTVVCEPMIRVTIETPSETVGAVLASVARLGGIVEPSSLRGDLTTIDTVMPATRVQDLQRELPGLTRGEGVLETNFAGYQRVSGAQPARRRTMANPLKRDEYMMELARASSRPTSQRQEKHD